MLYYILDSHHYILLRRNIDHHKHFNLYVNHVMLLAHYCYIALNSSISTDYNVQFGMINSLKLWVKRLPGSDKTVQFNPISWYEGQQRCYVNVGVHQTYSIFHASAK